MVILQFHQSSDELSEELAFLGIFPESDRELLVIHRHPRPACVRMDLELTPIGLQVMYRLVEVLRGWPKSLPRSLTSQTFHNRNGEFLEKLIKDAELITHNFTANSIDQAISEDLHLPDRLVYALLLTNVVPHSVRHADQCLICGLPEREDDRRERVLATEVELCYTNSICGYWNLMSISLHPGFGDGVFKLCFDHEMSLTRVFENLVIKHWYRANSTWQSPA